jgi:nucleoside-diphosphate-sugar epimerase
MSEYLVVGAGATGGSVARLLAEQDNEVRLITRSGSGPDHPLISRIAADASDAETIGGLALGCHAIFNCANPRYHRWSTDWPPIAHALLVAAERSGSVLVTLGNLYPYGRPEGPMSTDSPFLADYEKAQVRARMWTDSLEAHDSGRIRATEVRASDFVGPHSQSVLGDRVIPRVLRGKGCQVIGNPDQPHSWTYTGDVAATLVECARNPPAWGRAWHVPTNPARTQREAIDDIADVAGVPRVRISTIPSVAIRAMGVFSPMMRELPKTAYQFTAPFVIDDSATRRVFGLQPTEWTEVLRTTIESYRG